MTLQKTFKKKFNSRLYTIEDWANEPCDYYLVKLDGLKVKCQYYPDGMALLHAVSNKLPIPKPIGKIGDYV